MCVVLNIVFLVFLFPPISVFFYIYITICPVLSFPPRPDTAPEPSAEGRVGWGLRCRPTTLRRFSCRGRRRTGLVCCPAPHSSLRRRVFVLLLLSCVYFLLFCPDSWRGETSSLLFCHRQTRFFPFLLMIREFKSRLSRETEFSKKENWSWKWKANLKQK